MKDTFTTENANDFHRRYQGTFGWYIGGKTDTTKKLVEITEVRDRRCTFRDVDGRQYHATIDSGVIFEFEPLQSGWWNGSDNSTYLVQRVPARQWQRGVSRGNTSILRLFSDTLGELQQLPEITIEALHTIYVEGVSSVDAWQDYWKGNRSGAALSRYFAVGPSKRMYFKDKLIGECPENGLIKLSAGLCLQEVQDTVKRLGLEIQVNV